MAYMLFQVTVMYFASFTEIRSAVTEMNGNILTKNFAFIILVVIKLLSCLGTREITAIRDNGNQRQRPLQERFAQERLH